MITIDFTNIMASKVGSEHGLSKQELQQEASLHRKNYEQILKDRASNGIGFCRLPYQEELIQSIVRFSRERMGVYKNFIHVGIGGSALGAMAIHQALTHPLYNQIASKERGYWPKMYFWDNIDPEGIRAVLDYIDPKETLFHIVTKSGETTETLAVFLILLKKLQESLGGEYGRNLIVTTSRSKGFLSRFTQQEGLQTFEIPEDVGGRFSALTPVGLIPAAFSGIDISQLLSGAVQMDKASFRDDPEGNLAYQYALTHFLLDTKKGKNILVTMPYSGALYRVADWFRQLWAESLGKKYSIDGATVYAGSTPVNALGATDQHSQIQLYNEGPNDKVIGFVEVEKYRVDIDIPVLMDQEEAVGFLQGGSLGKLMEIEKKGTEAALVKNQRPNYTVKLPEITPQTIGAYLYFLEVATVFAAMLYRVNPYNQPGVEAGKRYTYSLLGRKGYEQLP